MVTARLAIGSVSTLAIGALLLGSAPYLLTRHSAGMHATPWGDVSALGVSATAAPSSGEDQAQLLKLAAVKSGTAAEMPAAPAIPASAAAPQADAAPAAQAVMASAPAPDQPAAITAVPSAPAQPAAEQAAQPPQQQVASLDDPSAGTAAGDDDAGKTDRVNINTASSSALDHLPGAGHIGHAIVSHRPYKSVKDLVSRRVLRLSDFQKIQGHIGVD